VIDAVLEGLPELLQQWDPLLFTSGYRIQLIFQPGREVVVDILGKIIGQELVHHATDIGRDEAFLVHLHVFAVLQGGDDRGIGGRPADAVLFQ